jgi:hypothetical protein
MSTKPKKVETPPDPDPVPISRMSEADQAQTVAREDRKKIMKNYGRQKTVLASAAEQKRNVLGG